MGGRESVETWFRSGKVVTDRECVEFLQWALPQLGLRWPGFRKVRRQVHKRIVRRLNELGLTQVSEYREYLRTNSGEWSVLDGLRFRRPYMISPRFHLASQTLVFLGLSLRPGFNHALLWR